MNYDRVFYLSLILATAILPESKAFGDASSAVDLSPPSVPADFAVTVLNDTIVKLTWTASTDNVGVAGYRVFESGSVIAESVSTSYWPENLTPQTNYSYQLRAFDAAGNTSAGTPVISVNTGDTHRPATPANLTALVLNDETIRLTWQAAEDNVATVGYKVYDRGEEVADVPNPYYVHQNLQPLTVYKYSVKAYDAAGNLSFEEPQLVVNTGDTNAPTAPQALTAEVLSDSRISLSWQPSSDNTAVAGYRIYERANLVRELTGTSFVHLEREPVTQYIYSVVAFDSRENLSPAATPVVVNSGDTTSPAAPQGLQAQVINDRRIRLSWQPTTDNVAVAGYLLLDRGEPFADVAGTVYDHVRLTPNTVYRYTVKAYDNFGNISTQMPDLVVNSGDTTAPLPPPGMEALSRGENEVRIQWDRPQDNVSIAGYRLFESGSLIADTSIRYFIHTGLTVDTEYHYTATSYDNAGNESDRTPVLTYRTPDNTRPTEPADLHADVLDDSSVLLTWSAASDNVAVAHYRIMDSGTQVGLAEGTKFLHEGLAPNTSHNYRVKAVDPSGNASPADVTISVNTGDTTPPTVPAGISAQVLDDGTVSLAWGAASDNVAVNGYLLFESGNLLADLDTPEFIHSGLLPMTSYSYTLTAYDASDNISGSTNAVSANTGDTTPPSVPGAFTLTLVDQSTIMLSWLASEDNVNVAGYEVLSDEQVIRASTSTGVVLTGLPPAEARSYAVRAVDHAGLRSISTAPLLASPSDDTSVTMLDETFLPVVAYMNTVDRGEQEREISEQELQQIATSYEALQVQVTTQPPSHQLDEMRAIRPGFQTLPYMNSSHSRSAAEDIALVEAQRLSMINVYLEAYLNAPVSSTDLTLSLRTADPERGWGLVASTVAGEFTVSAQQYVTYVRIDDELMRIEALDANTGLVTVSRGFAGSVPSAHSADAPVLAPVYSGPGSNGSMDPYFPGNNTGALPSYSLQVGTPAAALYFSDRVEELMQSGADGAWLDICSPAFFNQVNAVGAVVVPWNLETQAQFSAAERRVHQDRKLGRMQQNVLSSTGRWPALVANNNADGRYFEERGRGMDFLLPTSEKPVPIDAVVLEHVFSRVADSNFFTEARWERNLSSITHGAQNGLPVWAWIQSATTDYRPDTPEADRFELYDYGSVLLGWEMQGEGRIALPLFAESGSDRRINLGDWLFLDLGQPVDRAPYDAVEQLRVPETNTYLRRWTKGVVLVNPSSESDPSVPLPGQYVLPTTGQKVSSIGVPEHTAILLILDD